MSIYLIYTNLFIAIRWNLISMQCINKNLLNISLINVSRVLLEGKTCRFSQERLLAL